MIRNMLFAIVLYVLLSLQLGWSPNLAGSSIPVWLPALALIACLEMTDGVMLLVWSAAVGLLTDSLSLDQLGINVLITTLLATAILFLRSEERTPTITSVVVTTLMTTLIWRLTLVSVLDFLEDRTSPFETLAIVAIKNSIANGVIAWAFMVAITLRRNMFTRDLGPTLSLRNRWTMLTNP